MIQISRVNFSGARVHIGSEVEMSLGACEYDEQTGHIRIREFIVVPPPGTVMMVAARDGEQQQVNQLSAQHVNSTIDPPPAVPVAKPKQRR